MKRWFFGWLLLISSALLGGVVYAFYWLAPLQELSKKALELPEDWEQTSSLQTWAQEQFPSHWPFNLIHETLTEVSALKHTIQNPPALEIFKEDSTSTLTWNTLDPWREWMKKIDHSLAALVQKGEVLKYFYFLSDDLEPAHNDFQELKKWSDQALRAWDHLDWLIEQEASLIVLLQNTHEPRATGGFAGSFLRLQFSAENLTWELFDTYAYDRNLPIGATLESPQWFWPLSSVISWRDGNWWRDFPTSARQYLEWWPAVSSEPLPVGVLAVDLSVVSPVLEVLGPQQFPTWNLEFSAENWDLVLSFLVEAKIAGRYGVKEPVGAFIELLKNHPGWGNWQLKDWQSLPWKKWYQTQALQAYSSWPPLQNWFEKFGISGEFPAQPPAEANTSLGFDFVSIGANKSERFMQTAIEHDSKISPTGFVEHTLKITREHRGSPGGVQALLGSDRWPLNLKDQLSGDLIWTLGESQNRVYARVWIPAGARFLGGESPSGVVKARQEKGLGWQVIEIPLFVGLGETAQAQFSYETSFDLSTAEKNSFCVRIFPTAGRQNTRSLVTISPQDPWRFIPRSAQLGTPQPLIEQQHCAQLEQA